MPGIIISTSSAHDGTCEYGHFPARLCGVILDVDGTLYSQRRLRLRMMTALLRQSLTSPISQFQVLRLLSSYRAAQERLRLSDSDLDIETVQLRMAARECNVSEARAAATVDRWFRSEPAKFLRTSLLPGTLEFLDCAKKRGLRLGVFSDYPALAKLEALGLAGFFHEIVCASDADVQRLKPHPKGLRRCLERLGLAPEDAVYVGDRAEIDGECARRCGIYAAIIGRRTSIGPTFAHVRSYADLRVLLNVTD